jgi:hypothetical protein
VVYWGLSGIDFNNNNSGNVGIRQPSPAYELDILEELRGIGIFVQKWEEANEEYIWIQVFILIHGELIRVHDVTNR